MRGKMKITIPEEYPYLYETHLHTCQASACAKNTGAEMAKALKEAGYAGTFVTDHNWGGNTCINRELDWEDWMEAYASGYRDAKKFGDENDFQVFFGMETGYHGTEFLIVGFTPEWFKENPEVRRCTISGQYELVHKAGGMVVQAHPFRIEPYIMEVQNFPDDVDAFEGCNATHSSPLSISHNVPHWDDLARKLAHQTGKPMTSGSDIHSTSLFGGGIAFKTKLKDDKDYIHRILHEKDYIFSDGAYWRNYDGEIICPFEMK